MKDNVAQIHVERLTQLMLELEFLANEDIKPSLKRVKYDISLYNEEGQAWLKKIGKKPINTKDVILWLHYGQEKVHDALGYLQQLADELDDIEDEINRDEINNAE